MADEVPRENGVSKHTIFAWKAKHRGLEVTEAHPTHATGRRKRTTEEAGGSELGAGDAEGDDPPKNGLRS